MTWDPTETLALGATSCMSADRTREFLDTNLLVYAHDISAGAKRTRALDLLARLVSDRIGAVSVQVLQEFFVTVTSKVPGRLSAGEAAVIVADLTTLPTHAPSGSDVLAAIQMHQELQVSFWDAMVIRSASQLGCSILWSEDLTSGRIYEGVEVRNPFQ